MKSEPRGQLPNLLSVPLMAIAIAGCDKLSIWDSSHGGVSACEEKLKGSLVSPSSYRRQKAEYAKQQFTFTDYYEMVGGDDCKPFTASRCSDVIKLSRAMSVKMWLIAGKDLRAGSDIAAVSRRIENLPFPNVSDKDKWQADLDYLQFFYQHAYGPSQSFKLPAAVVVIDYDAVNYFNASLRSKYVCRFLPTNSDRYSISTLYL